MTEMLQSLYTKIQQDNMKKYPVNEEIVKMHTERLYTYIDNIVRTMEIIDGVTYLGYDLITDERKFDPYKIEEKHQKSKRKKFPIMPIDKSRFELMILHFRLKCKNDDGVMEEQLVDSELLLPKMVDGFYYQKNGNRFYPIFQIVEGSTYNRPNSVTFKTGYNAIIVSRKVKTIEDTTGKIYKGNQMFLTFADKPVPIPYIFMSLMSIPEFVGFFFRGNRKLLKLLPANLISNGPDPGRVFIKLNKYVYADVDKFALDNLPFMTDFVLLVKTGMTNKTTFNDINSRTQCLKKLGSRFDINKNNHLFKGTNVLKSFLKALDEVVKEKTRLPISEKATTLHILRNIIQNYDEYRQKNNLDLNNKRVRLNEHLIYHLNEQISKHCNRLLNKKDITMKNLIELVTFRRSELVTSIQKARLTRNDNLVNEMSILSLTEYSNKGPNSMSYMADCYRSLDPTHIGMIDIHNTSSSEPGLAGSLVASADIKSGGYFADYNEPNNFKEMLKQGNMPIATIYREPKDRELKRG